MRGTRCLILGGAGFIGSHLTDALLRAGHQVRVFDRPNVDTRNLVHSLSSIELYRGDIANEAELGEALAGCEVLVHLVSTTLPQSSNDNPVYDAESNVVGSLKLLSIAKDAGVRKIVFASSGGTVYGNPTILPVPEDHPTDPICAYGISKLAIEKYLRLFHHLHGIEYTVLRISNPFGERQNPASGQGAVTTFLWKLLNEEEITIWGDGSVARDYFHISDLTSAFLKAIERNVESRIFNIGSGHSVSLTELLARIQAVTGRVVNVRFLPGRKLDVPVNCLDIERARRQLAWWPQLSLAEGLSRTWDWLLENRQTR